MRKATVKLIEGFCPPEQKQEMIRKITATMVEADGQNLRLSPGCKNGRPAPFPLVA